MEVGEKRKHWPTDHLQSCRSDRCAMRREVVQVRASIVSPQLSGAATKEVTFVAVNCGGKGLEKCWVKRLKARGTHVNRDFHPPCQGEAVFECLVQVHWMYDSH